MPLDLSAIRSQFPALKRDAISLDNPAGTQIARTVLDRMTNYLVEHNANNRRVWNRDQSYGYHAD